MLTIKSLTNREPLIIFNNHSENTLEQKDLLKKIKIISQQKNDLHLYSHDENSSQPLSIKNDADISKKDDAKIITLKNVIKFIIGVSSFSCGVVVYRKINSASHYDINSYINDENKNLLLKMPSALNDETTSLPLVIKTKKSISDNKTIKKKQSMLTTPIDIITRRNKRINAKPLRCRKNVRKLMIKHIRMESISQP